MPLKQGQRSRRPGRPAGRSAVADDTRERVLDIAERLVQTRGFNAMSYADIAAELGVTKASLHYHFRTKGELGAKLIARYEEAFLHALGDIDARLTSAVEKLEAYAGLYENVLREDRICLCGMLAAEQATLPLPMRTGLRSFFTANEHWLSAVLDEGRRSGMLAFDGDAAEQARSIVSAFEGAMLVARVYGHGVPRFTQIASRVLAGLRPLRTKLTAPSRRRRCSPRP
jgi:TetR/AcrR family transcriptional regulator, transcriptional repressor for nem operon